MSLQLYQIRGGAAGKIPISDGNNLVAQSVSGDLGLSSVGVATLTSVIAAGGPIGSTTTVPVITWDAKGRLLAVTTATIAGSVPNGTVAGQILAWSGSAWAAVAVSGDATLASSGALTLASVITAGGPTGDASHVAQITYDAKGRLTAVSSVAIALSASAITSGTLPEARGGTNQSTYTTGDILYASAANTLSKLGVGSNGQVLTLAAGLPSWASVGSTAISGSANQMGYFSGTNVFAATSAIRTDNSTVAINQAPSSTDQLAITAAASKIGLTVTGASGQPGLKVVGSASGQNYGLEVAADSLSGAKFTNSATPSANSGGQIVIGVTGTPSAADQRVGIITFVSTISAALATTAQIKAFSSQAHSAGNAGGYLTISTVPDASTTSVERIRVTSAGSVILNKSGSALATSFTDGCVYFATCAGTPTGALTSGGTGTAGFVGDTNSFSLWGYMSSAWRGIGLGHSQYTTQNKTSAYTCVLGDGCIFGDPSGGNFAVKLPDSSTTPEGYAIAFKNMGTANTLTVALLTTTDSLDGTVNGTQALATGGGGRGVWVNNKANLNWIRISG